MTRSVRFRLLDILSGAHDAILCCKDLDDDAFTALSHSDRLRFRALKNALSEIGEAVKLLPPDIPARHPTVDWRGWAGLRDVVSHQYFALDLRLLRPAMTDDLPLLIQAIEEELAQEP